MPRPPLATSLLRLPDLPRPASPLERLRWLFLAFSAVMTLAMVPLLLVVPGAGASQRIAGVAALGLLLGMWVLGSWRSRFARSSAVAEGVLLYVVASAVEAPIWALGVFYVGLYLRVLHEDARGTALLTISYILAFGAAIVTASGPDNSFASPYNWLQLGGLGISGAAMYLLSSTMARHERALQRERLLSSAGARLAGSRGEQEVADIAVEMAQALLGSGLQGRVALARRAGDRMVVRASRGRWTSSDASGAGDAAEPSWVGHAMAAPTLMEVLADQSPHVHLTHADEGRWAAATALGVSPRAASVSLLPLRSGDNVHGVLVLEAPLASAGEMETSMASLATQVALALESRARTDAYFRSCVQHSSDVITIVRSDGIVQYQSPAIRRVFGHDPDAMPGTDIAAIVHAEDRHHLRLLLAVGGAPDTPHMRCDCRVLHADGDWRNAEITITDLRADPNVNAIVLNTRDTTAQRALEAQLAHQAFHDPLTGLANRALFRDRVVHAMAQRQRRVGDVVVVFVDLDNFKTVNDGLGHSAGDLLLTMVAQRLRAAVRGSDTVARLGGDEFGILMEDVKHEVDVEHVTERVLAAMRAPIMLEGRATSITVSMGSARAQGDDDTEALLRNADVAMYAAKQRGKGRHEMFVPEMHEAARDRLEIAAGLREALARGEFLLHYQPIVNVATGEIRSVEALVRWQHAERGLVPPSLFIPIAEDTGFIIDLGRWVLRESCRQVAAWRRAPGASAIARDLSVSVNVSGRQLSYSGLTRDVSDALARSGLPPQALTLEITESVVVEGTEAVIERLAELRTMGIRLAIDDFGTGYSSLSYLHRLPIDALKIDRAFTEQLDSGARDAALARAIVALGHTLDLRTVAEGVETPAQRAELVALACELAQGYLFSRPVPSSDLEALLALPALAMSSSATPRLVSAPELPAAAADPASSAA